jgi:MoxR-like ATPase
LVGVPGLAKTLLVQTISDSLGLNFNRIQFTPDLMPSDIVGAEILDENRNFKFVKGPLFANIILADEINRTPPKTQSALLEAMQERSVTNAGTRYELDKPFFVLATQNPIEQEGTYPLPEAQMDRFLLKVNVAYPDDESELEIMRLVRAEEKLESNDTEKSDQTKVNQRQVFEARKQVQDIFLSEAVEKYIVALVLATRHPDRYTDSPLSDWISIGSSPRASIGLDKATRAYAWLQGKEFADPDDVRAMAKSVLAHRLILSYQATADGVSGSMVIDEIIRQVAVA